MCLNFAWNERNKELMSSLNQVFDIQSMDTLSIFQINELVENVDMLFKVKDVQEFGLCRSAALGVLEIVQEIFNDIGPNELLIEEEDTTSLEIDMLSVGVEEQDHFADKEEDMFFWQEELGRL